MTQRGPCPPALAAEVYALTLARVRRKYRASSPHQQTTPDAVGEAHVVWLAGPSDKTAHPARLHAHWVAKLAHTYLHGTSRRRGARHVVGCASANPVDDFTTEHGRQCAAHFERLLRGQAGEPEPEAHEDALIAGLDLARRVMRGRPAADSAEALLVLRDRGWSVAQVAGAAEVSETAVASWIDGTRRPSPASAAALVRLATTDGPPPPPLTRQQARHAHAPGPDAPSAEQVADALVSLLRSHTRGSLARLLDVTPQAVGSWASGLKSPRPARAAALVRLALTEQEEPAIMAA